MNHLERQAWPDDEYQRKGVRNAWKTLLDAHNAILYGFVQCRLPEPGRPIDVAEAEAHIDRIEREWAAESQRRDLAHQWTGSPPLSKMPLNAKLYLHSVLSAEKLGNDPEWPSRAQP